MSHTINDLRDHLFGTLASLRDKENPMPIDRAKAIADVSQTIINSAKVEVDMINAVGAKNMQASGFLPAASTRPAIEHTTTTPTPGKGLPPPAPSAKV